MWCFSTRPETRNVIAKFTFPRQREGRKLSIADFFEPKHRASWM